MIVLDTHAWIWYIDSPQLLSDDAQDAIEDSRRKRAVYVSCISTWEVFMLVSKGRLQFAVEPDV